MFFYITLILDGHVTHSCPLIENSPYAFETLDLYGKMASECNKTGLNTVSLLVFHQVKKKVNSCFPKKKILGGEVINTHNHHIECWI